jgi:hypothetical protein
MGYRGSCACGAVTATISAEPVVVRQCWCRQCQQVAGGGPTHNVLFPTDAVTMSGPTAQHAYMAASGNTLTHEFCAECGTPVLARSSARPHFRVFRLGFLDAGHGLSPSVAIWTDDAPDWAVIDPRLEQVRQQPAPPPDPSTKA